MKYLKIFSIYCIGVMTVIMLLAEIFRYTLLGTIAGYLILLTMLAMLFHIGKVMQNILVKKKYFVYISVIAFQVIILQTISAILNVSLTNTWFAFIGVNVVFLTIFIMLIDIARTITSESEKVALALYVIVFIGAPIFLIVNAIALITGFL